MEAKNHNGKKLKKEYINPSENYLRELFKIETHMKHFQGWDCDP